VFVYSSVRLGDDAQLAKPGVISMPCPPLCNSFQAILAKTLRAFSHVKASILRRLGCWLL
jgi:hypothetical protein